MISVKIKFQVPCIPAVIAICLMFAYLNIEARPQDRKVEPSDDDMVYTSDKIDEKAVIDHKSRLASMPSGRGCGNGQWIVQLKVILHKSGKVTDVVVYKKSGCEALDRKAMKAAKKVKFTPAKKDGKAVSTYYIFQQTATVG